MTTDTAPQSEQTPATDGFFAAGTTRVPLDERGHWVEFKNGLDFREALTLLYRTDSGQGSTPEARADAAIAELVMYITDWHLTDTAGTAVPFSPHAVAGLTPSAAQRIRDLLRAQLRTQAGDERNDGTAAGEGQEGKAPPPEVATP